MKWLLLILIVSLAFFNAKGQKATHSESFEKYPSQIDKFPTFLGGEKTFYKFLSKNLKWPGDKETSGRVIVSFSIEKDGRLTNFKVQRSLGKDFDAEAIRVLKKSPKWIPAMKDGKAMRTQYYIPINFTLSE